jgi:hypothetical protein
MRALRVANSKVRIVIVSHSLQRDSVSLWLVALAIRILRRQADLQYCLGQIGVGDSSTGFGPEAASQPDEEDLVTEEVVSRQVALSKVCRRNSLFLRTRETATEQSQET